MNCEIISASAGTGKTYTMAIKYLSALNEGVNFENILVITFTKKATAEIRERIMIFLENIIFSKGNYEDLISSLSGEINYFNLKKAYENMLKNSENIKIFTNDSFINKIFKNSVAPQKNIFNYEMVEENSTQYIDTILNKIVSNEKYFKIFKSFYDVNSNEREIENYREIISQMLELRPKIYLHLDNFSNLKKEKVESFLQIKEEILEYLKDKETSKLTNLGKSFLVANSILDVKDIYKSGLVSRSKDDFEIYYKETLVPKLVKIYVNEVIIPYNIYYKQLAKICYEIDECEKFENCSFTFNDISFYTFKSGIDPSIVFPNIDFVMIDEFQDTDAIQFEIILKLIKKAKSLLIVGDEKQAIYAFRGGDVKLFRNLEKLLMNRIENIKITRNTLDTCYRSKENIINFINDYFSNISNFNYEKVLFKKSGGYVKLLDTSVDIVDHLSKNNILSNTAILVRNGKSGEEYKKALDEKNIKYETSQTKKISDDVKIQSFLKLISYLVNNSLYDLLEFLRSDLACFSLENIKTVIKNKGLKEIEILKKENINFKKEYLNIFGYGINPDKETILNLNKILDLVCSFYNLKDFIDYYNDKGKNIKKEKFLNDNGISIATIHASKGLEYDNVYVVIDFKNENFAKFRDVAIENDIIFLKNKNYLQYHEYSEYIQKYMEEENLENLNLLYVALTRAKNNLFLYVKNEKKILEYFKNTVVNIGEFENNKNVHKELLSNDISFTNKIFFENTNYIKENVQEQSIEKELSRKKGLALHYFMENVKYLEDIELSKSMFLRKYGNLVGPHLTESIINTCINYINTHKEMFSNNNEIFTEYPIIDEKGVNYRIDRISINKNDKKIIIYDYKTKALAEYDDSYQKQIENYKNIVSKMEEFKDYLVLTKIIPLKISES